jgi:dipeptidyl-peptidase-4
VFALLLPATTVPPRTVTLTLALLSATTGLLPAQQEPAPDSSVVTLDRIFDSDFFDPQRVPPYRWTPDGSAYYSNQRRAGAPGPDLVRVDPVTGDATVLVRSEQLVPPGDTVPLRAASFRFSEDGRKVLLFTNTARVWRANTRGDYWVLDLDSGSLRKLGGRDARPSTLMFAKFSPQGDRVAYVREHNIYVERVKDGRITALTRDGSRTTINGTFDWVYEEEFGLRDGFRWSPDGRRIAYWQLDATGVRDFLLINNTDSLYSFTKPVQYPKAGTTNSAVRVGVVDASGGRTRWMALPGDPRNIYVARMEWAAGPDAIIMQHLNRLQNTLTLLMGDVRTGRTTPIMVERDSAWVDVVDDWEWLPGGDRFLWVSERDGWRHVYTVSRDGGDTRRVTAGDFDVETIVSVDLAGGWIYFTASPENPTQRYLYRAALAGGGPAERLSPAGQGGTHRYQVSPGARYAIHSFSSFSTPPVTSLIRLPSHEVIRTLADNAELKRRHGLLRKGPVQFVRVDAGNGVSLDGWVMYPADFDSTRRYPVVFHVYGEPAGQTATDSWGANDPWHLMLTQQGYAVMSFDNRGTPSPRGRAWRKSIYRKIGVYASEDQAGVARVVRQWPWVDSTRVGVWGWSGGGSMTLNMLFRFPELYHTGMSVAPVPDVHLYDTIYQERYMGLPEGENEENYRQSSPLTFADRLRGNLLVVHGTGDDNVHYQGTERLINALVAANKPFTMMAYPNRTHGIYEGEGTTLHLYGLLTRFLTDNLPAGGR